MTAKTRVTVSLPAELRAKLLRLAEDQGVSLSAVIEEMLRSQSEELTPDERWELRGRPKPTVGGIASSKGRAAIDWESDLRPEPRTWRSF
jgi:hypothetical protein